ncbi:hypothetical protein OG306_29870 [Streptomyces sp. NBC_01241]|uniref:hypothetical protein n=1 Tax=Streptomyces sp. NBC_01241 TaxID=2903794 RepID=UPI00352C3F3E|nr:hypothetical protein OG306_29870 [Streptomyces sp. NBC_01241]
MSDWFGLEARQTLKERRQKEERLAWSALWDVATRTPFLRKVDVVDEDSYCYTAEVLVDSGPIINSLDALAYAVVDPNAAFFLPLVEAAREVRVLADMFPAWTDHCDARFPAPAGQSDDTPMKYINGRAMRAWSRADEAEAAVERAQQALDRLYPALIDFYGYDVVNGRWAA